MSEMTVHFVTEINDIFGTEQVHYVTSHAEDAARAGHLLRCQGRHVEVREFAADTQSLAEFERDLAA